MSTKKQGNAFFGHPQHFLALVCLGVAGTAAAEFAVVEAPPRPRATTTADEGDDWQLLQLLVDLMCSLLGCDLGDPLLPLAASAHPLLKGEIVEEEIEEQIKAFYASGPRDTLDPAERRQGKIDAVVTRTFIFDHPLLVSIPLASDYTDMLADLINVL